MARAKKEVEELATVEANEETVEVPTEEKTEDKVVTYEAVCLGCVLHNRVMYVPGDCIEFTEEAEYRRLLDLKVVE